MQEFKSMYSKFLTSFIINPVPLSQTDITSLLFYYIFRLCMVIKKATRCVVFFLSLYKSLEIRVSSWKLRLEDFVQQRESTAYLAWDTARRLMYVTSFNTPNNSDD